MTVITDQNRLLSGLFAGVEAHARATARTVKARTYLAWLHELPCVISHARPVEAAHLSFAEPAYGHFGRAKARKASDRWALPLAPALHAAQHTGSERRFWVAHGIDPHLACLVLYGLFNERGDDALPHAERMIKTRLIGRNIYTPSERNSK